MTHDKPVSDHSLRKVSIWLQSALVLSFSFYAGVTYQRMNVVEAANKTMITTLDAYGTKIVNLEWQIRETINTQARQTGILEKLVNERKK